MSKKSNNTGIGRGADAFFDDKDTSEETQVKPAKPKQAKKMRTTVMLSPEVVAGIEALRTQARKNGNRLTTSKIIEEALKLLMRERRIEV